MSFCHMRIARPVSELDTTASMYCAGLGLELLGSFTDHEGFSGIMLGAPRQRPHGALCYTSRCINLLSL